VRDLFEELWSLEYRVCGDQEFAKAWARNLLGEHAHGLAEKIRNTPSPRDPDDYCGLVDMGADWAADLIDPKKEGQ